MVTLLLYLTFALIILLTVRLAQSQGRNPWLWGISSFLLMFSPGTWKLLSLIPIIILLLARKSQPMATTGPGGEESRIGPTCPRCHTPNSADHRYCINCGWELRRPYSPDIPAGRDDATVQTAATLPSSEATRQNVPAGADAKSTGGSEETPETQRETMLNPVLEPSEGKERLVEESQLFGKAEPSQESTATEKPVFRSAPTAASMTERGLLLFNQGRFQEAVDQFTKAIALDPRYKLAWAHRAEAYAKLGRGKEAAEDKRRLEAI